MENTARTVVKLSYRATYLLAVCLNRQQSLERVLFRLVIEFVAANLEAVDPMRDRSRPTGHTLESQYSKERKGIKSQTDRLTSVKRESDTGRILGFVALRSSIRSLEHKRVDSTAFGKERHLPQVTVTATSIEESHTLTTAARQ